MTPAIAQLARRAVAYQEPGGLIDQRRLFANLLSSMPLCFNLFGSLALDRLFAARLVRRLFPQIDCKAVEDVRFEHSPGRDHPGLTADRSAFDVVVLYQRTDGACGFICFEIKYSENLQEGQPLDASSLYDSLADSSGVYKEPHSALLRVNPLQQLFREHMLAQAAVIRGDWAEATFVVVAPEANHAAQRASALYAAHLTPSLAGQVPFANISLETFIAALGRVGDADFANALHDRYCAWWKVHEQVDAAIRAGGDQWSLASRQPTASVAAPRSRKAA